MNLSKELGQGVPSHDSGGICFTSRLCSRVFPFLGQKSSDALELLGGGQKSSKRIMHFTKCTLFLVGCGGPEEIGHHQPESEIFFLSKGASVRNPAGREE